MIMSTTLGTLAGLPEPCLVHALLFLADLDDLLRFASTNSAARAFLHAHWAQLKPNGEPQRRAFVARMASWREVARSSFFTHEQQITTLPPPRQISSPSSSVTWEIDLLRNHRLDLDREVFGDQAWSQRRSRRSYITALWVSCDWMEDDSVDGRKLKCLDLESRGQRILRIDTDNARLDRAPDGRLDLMRYLHRLPMHLAFAHYVLVNFSAADITVTVTVATAAPSLVEEEEEEGAGKDEWVIDVLSASVRVAADAAQCVQVRVPDELLAVEHITIQFLDHHAGRPLLQIPRVARFTLYVKWSYETSYSAPHHTSRAYLRGTWHNDVAGWACRVAGGYRLPMQRLCFLRLDKVELEVHFFASSPPLPVGAMITVCTTGHDIAIAQGEMMGLLFVS